LGSLSKDSRLVFFEYDKDSSSGASANSGEGRGSGSRGSLGRKPLLTKVVASVDISTLENHSIQATHESVTGRRHSFSVQTKERTIYLSATSSIERDEWVLICNKHLFHKNQDPNKLRTAVSIFFEIQEARGLSNSDIYAEIKVDELLVAVTSTKYKSSTPYWGEEFTFDDLREIDIGVVITLKQLSASRIQKDATLGHCFISADTLMTQGFSEGWMPLMKGSFTGKPSTVNAPSGSNSEKAEVKLHVRYQTTDVMPLDKYADLSNCLDNMDAEPMFEMAKLSDHLESTARNFLRIFLGKGTALQWLKKLVACEILQTDNTNIMFRANSIGTKAIDQYIKVIGMEYLEKTIGDVVRGICDSKYSCEVDPTRLQKGEDLNQNWQRLIGFVTNVFSLFSFLSLSSL
jgi:hypothetical protein